MERLRRKIDEYLINWKKDTNKKPLIVKENFARNNYKHLIEINFALQKQYKTIFDNGFEVDTIIRNISLINPNFEFVPGETLVFFDEIQDCVNAATSLKSFNKDARFDVIC